MKMFWFIFLFSLALSCNSANPIKNVVTAQTETMPNSKSAVSPTPPTGDCSETESFCLEITDDAKREAKNLNVVSRKPQKKWTIQLPSPQDYNGYALNWAKKTANGFEISIEYGSKIYYDKTFLFSPKDEGFELTEIKIKNFDKAKPENEKIRTVKITPPVSIESFDITAYMNN